MKTHISIHKTIECMAVALALAGCTHSRHPGVPAHSEIVPVLRCRELVIVDERGKDRAQIVIYPASITKEGRKYPETVLLRLIDQNGRPAVKIGASDEGTAISFAGDSERREWNGVQILANEEGSTIKLTNKDGQERVIKP